MTIKYRANWKRINHDLHNTPGFYALPLLLIMALTGLCWSFEWYSNGVSKLIGAEVWGEYYEKPLSSDTTQSNLETPLSNVIMQVDQHFPYRGNLFIRMPKDKLGTIIAEKTRTGFFTLAAVDKLTTDQYNGKVLKIDAFDQKSNSEKLVSLVRPLHIGSVYGIFSKIIYFLACLIATSLPVTGSLIYLHKLKKKSDRSR